MSTKAWRLVWGVFLCDPGYTGDGEEGGFGGGIDRTSWYGQ